MNSPSSSVSNSSASVVDEKPELQKRVDDEDFGPWMLKNLVIDDESLNIVDKPTEELNGHESGNLVDSIKRIAGPRKNKPNAKEVIGPVNPKSTGGDQIVGFHPVSLIAKLDKSRYQTFRAVRSEKENRGLCKESLGMDSGIENRVFRFGVASNDEFQGLSVLLPAKGDSQRRKPPNELVNRQ
ncbi:hypothetical protein Godav_027523 [Gossypium davidsonii]|uniref:Uncharacterized protein n=1 Tax=Gossypium davidsonii TaxID=34287 RepID=A0A7J8RWW5_GOSDV|nr:hypothetical protein [Gossypium davidsonii]